jgi:mannose-1-phosphate guanylyltransferase
VLAGGEGERLKAMTTRWLGLHRPKQYCSFAGGRTMLEHTLDRAASVVDTRRLVTIIGRGHGRHLEEAGLRSLPGRVIEQPANLDTAPGVLLPLAHIRALDPEAVVGVFPSDHFIRPKEKFQASIERSFELAEELGDRIVLLGAEAEGPETEYGWIEPGEAAGRGARSVASFVEKPSAERAEACYKAGGVWNTLIMAFKLRAVWDLSSRLLPEVFERFRGLSAALERRIELDPATLYSDMPRANFSRDLLERSPSSAVVLPMRGVEWSDWGRPERIAETLKGLGRTPAFPLEAFAHRSSGPLPSFSV